MQSSTSNIQLTVDPVYAVNDSISIVQGDSAFVGGGWQTAPGIYYDTLTAMNGCDSIVATTLTVVIGINQSSINKHQFSIFPNPNSGEFTIKMELAKPQEMEMELLNVIGQAVYKESLGKISGSYQKQLDLNGLAKGIYTLQLISEEGTTTRKIILE